MSTKTLHKESTPMRPSTPKQQQRTQTLRVKSLGVLGA